MSKITDAMKRAEASQAQMLRNGSTVSGYFKVLKQELWEEVRQFEEAFSRRGALPATTFPSAVEVAVTSAHTQPVSQESVQPTQTQPPYKTNGGPVIQVSSPGPESWDQAIELVKKQLEAYEQRAAQNTGEQVTLNAQLTAHDQLMVTLDHEREALKQRLEEQAKATSAIESEKASWVRQLEALRECQVLSHAASLAEEELRANASLVAHITQSQQRVAQEHHHYQQRGEQLTQLVEQLQFKLGQALAFTGTTDVMCPTKETVS